MSTNEKIEAPKVEMPSLERIQEELASAKSIDDFFGKGGIFYEITLFQIRPAAPS